MNCKKCLAPLTPETITCPVCGEPVTKEESVQEEDLMIGETPKKAEQEFDFYNKEEDYDLEPIAEKPVYEKVIEEPVEEPVKQEEIEEPVKTVEDKLGDTLIKEVKADLPPMPDFTEIKETKEEPQPENKQEVKVIKKTNKLLIFVVIIVTILLTVIIGGLILAPIVNKKIDDAKTTPALNQSSPTETTVTEYRIRFGNYTFLLPENYTYQVTAKELIIADETGKQSVSIQIGTASYETLSKDIPTLKTNLTKAGWVLGNYEAKQIGTSNYVTYEASVGNQKVMLAYTKLSDTNLLAVTYLDTAATSYPTDLVEKFNKIVTSAEKDTTVSKSTIANFTKNNIIFATTKK